MNLEITISIVCIYQDLENNSISLQKLTLVGRQTLCVSLKPPMANAVSKPVLIIVFV